MQPEFFATSKYSLRDLERRARCIFKFCKFSACFVHRDDLFVSQISALNISAPKGAPSLRAGPARAELEALVAPRTGHPPGRRDVRQNAIKLRPAEKQKKRTLRPT